VLFGAVRILVTGGCGFIGSNFIRYVLQHYKPASLTNVDVLTYAGNLANLDGVVEEHGERYEFFKADIANADQMDAIMTEHQFFAVVNFARKRALDAEELLNQATAKFGARFQSMERRAQERGLAFSSLAPAQKDQLWEEAKVAELEGAPASSFAHTASLAKFTDA